MEDARGRLDDMKVTVTPGYERYLASVVRTLVTHEGDFEFQERPSTVREYLEHVARHPETKDM